MRFSDWVATIPAEGTRHNYTSILGLYLRFCLKRENEDIDALAEEYLETRTQPEQHMRGIDAFFGHIRTKAPMTQNSYLSVIRTWLREMYCMVPDGYWKKFSRRIDVRPITKEDIPKSEDLRELMSFLPTIGRAIFSFMAASGCRIGETTLMELDDIRLDMDPPRVYLRAETTKTKRDRVVFFTDEAREAIVAFLKVRERYITDANNKNQWGNRPPPELERRVFPLHTATVRRIWRNALRKAGKERQDERTGLTRMRPHTLRKRFRTQLGAVIPVDVVEVLMGHTVYMSTYQRYTEAELAEFYKEGEHVLYLSSDPAELKRLSRMMKAKEGEVEAMKLKLLELEARIAEEELRKVKD